MGASSSSSAKPTSPIAGEGDSFPNATVSSKASLDVEHGQESGMQRMLSTEVPRRTGLLERGAHCFLWVIGFWVTVKIMLEFANELKPLVLALIFVSILETIVQFWEAFFWYLFTYARIITRYAWLALRIVLRKMCRGCCSCMRRCRSGCCGSCEPPLERIEHDQLESRFLLFKDCRMLRWHPSLAGQNLVIRWLSVAVTLGIMGGVFVLVFIGLRSNVDQMIHDSEGYRRQAERVFRALERQTMYLPDQLPSWISNSTRDAIRHKLEDSQKMFDPTTMADTLQENLLKILTGFLSNTEQIVIGAVFFLLYTILCLCDPLHINQHGKLVGMLNKRIVWPDDSLELELLKFRHNDSSDKPQQRKSFMGELHSPKLLQQRMLAEEYAIDEVMWDAPDFEVQVHIYKIVWQYLGLTVVINLVFALAAWGLLFKLNLDLGGVIAVLSFFLSFIPELGTIVSTLLPIPLILFAPDCEIKGTCLSPPEDPSQAPIFRDWDERSKSMAVAFIGMLVIKFVVSNVFGSWLFSRSKVLAGQLQGMESRETHPVIVLFAVVVFGHIWGTVGMLISVPMLSVMRLMLNLGHYVRSKKK